MAAQRSYSVLQVSSDLADGHINYGTGTYLSLFTIIKIQIKIKFKSKNFVSIASITKNSSVWYQVQYIYSESSHDFSQRLEIIIAGPTQ